MKVRKLDYGCFQPQSIEHKHAVVDSIEPKVCVCVLNRQIIRNMHSDHDDPSTGRTRRVCACEDASRPERVLPKGTYLK